MRADPMASESEADDSLRDLTSHPAIDVAEAARRVCQGTVPRWMLDDAIDAWESQWPKRCACGRSYGERQWSRLLGGERQTFPWGEIHELRHCACGSTISILLAVGDPELEHDMGDALRDGDAVVRAMLRRAS